MSFSGKYELESQDKYEEFMESIDYLKYKTSELITIEITQDGDSFEWLQYTKSWRWNTKFIPGEEVEMKSFKGSMFMAHPKLEDGKILVEFPEFKLSAELVDDKLLLIYVTSGEKGMTFKRFFKRV